MKSIANDRRLFLHVQRVDLSWNKKARGGPAARFRNELPLVYPVEKNRARLQQYGKVEGYAGSGYFAEQEIYLHVKELDYAVELQEVIRLEEGILEAVRRSPQGLEILWRAPGKDAYGQVAVLLPCTWLQVQYNTWGSHRSRYARHVYNIFWGDEASLTQDIYRTTLPVISFRKGYYYSRY